MWHKQKQSTVHLASKLPEVGVVDKLDIAVPETPWRSIIVVSCFTFCTAAQFTLYFSSLWPFLQILDHTASESFYGLIVASYSLGQIISGPFVGWWSTKTKSIVNPCHFCLMLTLIGNITYVSASVLESNQKWAVLIGRFIVGLGESSLSLYQGFSSTASTHNDRSKALSITTGGLALGFCVGPAIQLLFTPIGYPGFHIYGKLWINMYTSPAIACCFINIICMLVLRLVFVEKYAGLANPNSKNSTEKKVHVPKYDKVAVGLCHLTRFIQLFAFTNLETIGTPFVMAIFALNSEKTVQTLSIVHSICGLLGFISYMFHAFQKSEIIDYRKLCIFGFLGFLFFHFLTLPMPFTAGNLKTYSAEDYAKYELSNHTSALEPVGCPRDSFVWCETTGYVNFWVYMVAMTLVLGFFWPNVNVSLSTLLSKILGPRRQTNQQSMFQMSASVARLIGPILISNLYIMFGPLICWLIEIAVLIFIIIVWLVQYRRLVPLQMPEISQIAPVELGESDSDEFVEDEVEENAHNFARF